MPEQAISTATQTTDKSKSFDQEAIQGMITEALGKEFAEQRKMYMKKGEEITEKAEQAIARLMSKEKAANEERGMEFARFVKAYMVGHMKDGQGSALGKAQDYAKKAGWHGMPEKLEKAMGENTLSSGGALVPVDQTDDFIGLIHDDSIVSQLGARSVPVPRGNLPIRKAVTGVTTSWLDEAVAITPSTPTTGLVNLQTHKLAGLVALSNELIYDSSDFATRYVRDEMSEGLAETSDLAYLRGLGTANTPKGMLYQVASGNTVTAAMAGTASTLAEVTSDMVEVVYLVMNDLKNKILRPGFAWAPRTWMYLFSLLTSTGAPAFQNELKMGTFFGMPFKMSTQIPINLGSGTNESEVYFADFARLMIGTTGGIEIKMSDTAAYYDGSAVQSSFSNDESVIRGIMRTGFAPRYAGTEIGIINTVKWGA